MGGAVVFDIHGFDRHLAQGNVVLRAVDEHIHLIFEPFPLGGEEPLDQGIRHGPQAGLGIGDLHAAKQAEDVAGHHIAEPAPGRDIFLRKVTAAQDQRLGMRQHIIPRICEYRPACAGRRNPPSPPRRSRHGVEIMVEGGFQRAALAAIDMVAKTTQPYSSSPARNRSGIFLPLPSSTRMMREKPPSADSSAAPAAYRPGGGRG